MYENKEKRKREHNITRNVRMVLYSVKTVLLNDVLEFTVGLPEAFNSNEVREYLIEQCKINDKGELVSFKILNNYTVHFKMSLLNFIEKADATIIEKGE